MTETTMTGYPSADKPWLKYYSEEAIKAVPAECSIYRNIYEHNKDFLSDTALLYFGKKISYGKLFREIDRAAAAFAAHGVGENDNVVICMPAVPETLYAFLALNKLGANACLMNPTFTTEQLIDRISETEAALLITVNELNGRLKDVIPATSVKTIVCCPAVNSLGAVVKLMKKVRPIKGTLSWNEFIRSGKGTAFKEAEHLPERPAVIVYSSGTTGASKGIQLTNKSINSTIRDYSPEMFPFRRGDKCFTQIPIWFSTGIAVSCLVPLTLGISCILEPVYNFNIFQKDIEKYRPNLLVTPSILIEYLIAGNSLSKETIQSFKYLCVGGDYIAPARELAAMKWFEENGNHVGIHKAYGMCECGGTVTTSSYKCNAFGSAGIPTAHVTVAAFDLTTSKELRYKERGELRVNSPCSMLGYFKNPEATEKFFHTDENGTVWACTGDMGYVDEDGSVYVSGRISDSYINDDGETVYLFDIERAVLDIPQVRQCKAVASEINGKTTHVCHIALEREAEEDTVLKAIQSRCREKLPDSYIPYYFKIHEVALPIGPSGKLDVQGMTTDTENLKEI